MRTITISGTPTGLVSCFIILREAIKAESVISISDFELIVDVEGPELHFFVTVKAGGDYDNFTMYCARAFSYGSCNNEYYDICKEDRTVRAVPEGAETGTA